MRLRDLTLREGEQRPGVTYTIEQKIKAARKLDTLGVDTIQLGFPVVDDRTERVVERVTLDAKTSGIARAVRGDVDAAVSAGVDVVDLFAPTSERQLETVVQTSRSDLTEDVVTAADYARDHGVEVVFNAMDGFRTDPQELTALFEAVDAETYVIADTVGCRTPGGVADYLDALTVPCSCLGVHFHNDLGVATANALTAARLGVDVIDVSIAGLGERAGNVPLEAFVAAAMIGKDTRMPTVEEDKLLPIAHVIIESLGESVEASTPLLGTSAFAHESGIHTAAMLDDPSTFEPFDPRQFGGSRRLLFGRSTGRGASRRLLKRANRDPTEERVERMLDRLASGETEHSLAEALQLARSIE